MSAVPKDKVTAKSHRLHTSVRIEVPLNSNSSMGLYRRKSVLRKRESTKIKGTAAGKANLKFKTSPKSGGLRRRQPHQLYPKSKQFESKDTHGQRTTILHRTSVKEVDENVGHPAASNTSNLGGTDSSSSARHHGPFLAQG